MRRDMLGTNRKSTVVSFEAEPLILVDENDNELGFETKARCHDGDGLLHRAFSVFLFDTKGRLLLQQRAAEKRLWPQYWSNSCCSHPRRGEALSEAVSRRLREELGIDCDAEFVYKFSYSARFDDEGSERELCSVFVAVSDQLPVYNDTEIENVEYLSHSQVTEKIADEPDVITPWFKLEWEALNAEHHELMQRICQLT